MSLNKNDINILINNITENTAPLVIHVGTDEFKIITFEMIMNMKVIDNRKSTDGNSMLKMLMTMTVIEVSMTMAMIKKTITRSNHNGNHDGNGDNENNTDSNKDNGDVRE